MSPILDPHDHALLRAFLDRFLPDGGAVETRVDSRDEMLDFQRHVGGGSWDPALLAYFRKGWEVAESLLSILEWRFGEAGPRRVLDFASGFGRVTRYLAQILGPDRIAVCEISEGAASFQREVFGVGAVPAALHPHDFACDQRFDAILVTSLFTHLPEETFGLWLGRLLDQLDGGGLLVFSVHDISLLQAAQPLPDPGHHFEATSESRTLDKDAYGSLWVSEGWVREQIAKLAPTAVAHHLPFALCDYQDLWVVDLAAADNRSCPSPPPIPQGLLEHCRLDGTRLEIGGWVLSWNPAGTLQAIVVELDGREVARIDELTDRSDVAASYRHQNPAYALGWRTSIESPPVTSGGQRTLAVVARDREEREHLLWLSTLEGARLHGLEFELDHQREMNRQAMSLKDAELADAHRRYAALDATLAAMRRSRFWRARELWFGLKRAIGIGDGR